MIIICDEKQFNDIPARFFLAANFVALKLANDGYRIVKNRHGDKGIVVSEKGLASWVEKYPGQSTIESEGLQLIIDEAKSIARARTMANLR